jgi:hypothetical protein
MGVRFAGERSLRGVNCVAGYQDANQRSKWRICGGLVANRCLLAATGAIAPRASAKAKSTVSVVLCRTEFVPGSPPAIPTKIAVDGNPSSVRGLAAYTNYDTYLIAPAGMACKGEVAEDGGRKPHPVAPGRD